MTILLTLDADRVVARVRVGMSIAMHIISRVEHINDLLEMYPGAKVVRSSTIDFPEEHTKDAAVIELCQILSNL